MDGGDTTDNQDGWRARIQCGMRIPIARYGECIAPSLNFVQQGRVNKIHEQLTNECRATNNSRDCVQ